MEWEERFDFDKYDESGFRWLGPNAGNIKKEEKDEEVENREEAMVERRLGDLVDVKRERENLAVKGRALKGEGQQNDNDDEVQFLGIRKLPQSAERTRSASRCGNTRRESRPFLHTSLGTGTANPQLPTKHDDNPSGGESDSSTSTVFYSASAGSTSSSQSEHSANCVLGPSPGEGMYIPPQTQMQMDMPLRIRDPALEMELQRPYKEYAGFELKGEGRYRWIF